MPSFIRALAVTRHSPKHEFPARLYGTVGVQYFVDKTATPELPASWQLWQTITLTNLWKTLDAGADSNAPSIFYRARE